MCKLLVAGSLSRAVVLAGACLLLSGCPDRPPAPAGEACVAQGVASLAHARWVEPRLMEGFTWQPCRLGRNGDVDVAACPQPPHPAKRPVSMLAGNCRMHVKALTTLLLEPARTDDAVAQLEELAERAPAVEVRSDLAAAYAVRAQRLDWPSDLLRSADAALKASRTPAGRSRPEIWFNLALAEQGIELSSPALDSWRTYLRLDPDSAWAGEARQRLRRLEDQRMHEASTAWSLALGRLSGVVEVGDEEALAQLVAPFREAAGRHVEEDVLPAWAAARARGDEPAAGRALTLARAIARALASGAGKRGTRDRGTGDVYLSEVVGAIDQALQTPVDRRRLALLERGHHLFGEARRARRAHHNQDAAKLFGAAGAALGQADSPLRYGARLDLETAGILDQAARRRALVPLAELARQAEEHGYTHLQGRALWIRAHGLYLDNDLLESLSSYDRALASFARLGDRENVANVQARKAGILRTLGELELGWREARRALSGFSSVVELQSQHYILGEAARIASELGFPDVGLLYQQQAVQRLQDELASPAAKEAARHRELLDNLAIVLRERSRIHLARGDSAAALRDINEAIGLSARAIDADSRRLLEARAYWTAGNAHLAEARRQGQAAARVNSLQRAVASLTTALGRLRRDELSVRASILFARAEARRGLGEVGAGEADLKAGIDDLQAEEERILALPRRDEREWVWMAYFSRFQEAYRLLIRSLVERREYAEAFAYAERARAFEPLNLVLQLPFVPAAFKRLAAGPMGGSLAAVQRELPQGTVVLEYCVLEDRTFLWLIWREGYRFQQLPVGRKRIERWAATLQALARERDVSGFEAALSAPFAELVSPLLSLRGQPDGPARIDRVVFVPDGAIHGLPLGALSDDSGRHVIEDFTVSVAPSATLYVHSLMRDRSMPKAWPPSALLVGDPAFENRHGLFEGLPRLRRASAEVKEIAPLYGRSIQVLDGPRATVGPFLKATRTSTVVHFAGHALMNSRTPFQSLLLLAPSPGDSGALTAERLLLAPVPAQARLFVLGACGSAGGRSIGPSGLAALVRPLVAAGVPAVAGSLWNVGDDVSKSVLVRFHRHYVAGEDAARALQLAQLDLLHATSAGPSQVISWAPFQVVGYASSPFAVNQDPSRRE